jgi:hypothetical protein
MRMKKNMESTDIRENGNGLRMLESQSVDINTRDNDSRGEGRANSENDKNTQYVKEDKSSSDHKMPVRSPDQI